MTYTYQFYEDFIEDFNAKRVCIHCNTCADRNYVVRWLIENESYYVDPNDDHLYLEIESGTALNDRSLYVSAYMERQFECSRTESKPNCITYEEFTDLILGMEDKKCDWKSAPISALLGIEVTPS